MTDTTTDTGSDGFTAAERAYIESRGAKTDGLVSDEPEGGSGGAAPAPAAKTADEPAAKPAATAKPAEKASDLDPDEEPLGEDGKPKNPGRFIRFGAFDKERRLRQETERALATEREKQARLAERLDLLNAALTTPKAEEKPAAAAAAEPPDPEKDIFGFVRWQNERLQELQRQVADATKQGQEHHKQTAEQIAERDLKSAYFTDAQRFAAANPDFGDAYQHLLKGIDQELALFGHADPKQRAALIAQREREIVTAAVKAGTSPAAQVYAIAKLRGYAPAATSPTDAAAAAAANGAASPTAAAAAGSAGNGASNGNGAAAPAKSSVSDEIARIKAGQDASKSLSSVGGTAGGALTPEALVNMPEHEFQAWVAKASKSQVRAMLGG